MRDLKKEFTIPNGVNTLNATASLDPFYGPFDSVDEAYNLVPEAKRAVGKLFAIYLDSTESNIKLYYWITNGAGAEWRPVPLIPNIDTDRVVSLGAITVNGSVVTIGLHSGGTNSVEINNAIYSRYEPISFTIGPIIVAGNFRKDIIEARADSTVFYLKKGVESINPVPPAVTDGALFISEVLVTSTGVSAGALNSVVTDSTMKGDGTSENPLGLSEAKNAEIAGKISKAGINLGDTGNIPEMKGGAISGIYRGNYGSTPVYVYSPFLQMTAADTFAQVHVNHENGEMSYRAGTLVSGYSALRTSWDNVNLPSPATQTQLATKQDKSMFSALVDKMVHFYDSVTGKMQPIIKLVTGAINQLEFDGRMKLASLILPPNSSPNVANRLWSDGTYVYYDNGLAIPKRLGWSQSNVFVYTPTGNFTVSAIKTEMENAGYVFNDSHIIINLGSNSFTCSIDIGASNPNTIITTGKRGSGTLSFSSTRTLTATDFITIMNGNEGSMAMLQFGTTVDFLTIRNL